MSARYTALPNPRSIPEAEQELDDAFGPGIEEDGNETTPLTRGGQGTRLAPMRDTSVPGAYDFEREYDYDYPPPGSPPRPSSFALPNDIGNSNGRMPSSPVRVPMPQPSLFRRAVGAILPTHYTRVPAESSHGRARGGGLENDGVFANVTAKPQRAREIRTEGGEAYLVPEESQKDVPPSYADAQLDSVPPYWETTVHAPSRFAFGSDMIIDDLPSGSIWIFVLNLLISFFFQFVGFLLTYLLHTSHAAKYGSRAGLGITLIQFGFYARTKHNGGDADGNASLGADAVGGPGETIQPPTPSQSTSAGVGGVSSREWMAFLFMTLGWFLLLSSTAGFWRVKRWEASIRSSSNPAPISSEDIERDIAVRRNLENVFGIRIEGERDGGATALQSNELPVVTPVPESSEAARSLVAARFM